MIKITEKFLGEISEKARASSRKRTNWNFHASYDEIIQRLLNAGEPGTYIQPHKHQDPDKIEVFIILKGSVVVVEYGDDGSIKDHAVLDPAGESRAVEIPPGMWHSFIVLKPGSVLYEFKDGPYNESADKRFAPWAPKEGAPGAKEFNKRVLASLGL